MVCLVDGLAKVLADLATSCRDCSVPAVSPEASSFALCLGGLLVASPSDVREATLGRLGEHVLLSGCEGSQLMVTAKTYGRQSKRHHGWPCIGVSCVPNG